MIKIARVKENQQGEKISFLELKDKILEENQVIFYLDRENSEETLFRIKKYFEKLNYSIFENRIKKNDIELHFCKK